MTYNSANAIANYECALTVVVEKSRMFIVYDFD